MISLLIENGATLGEERGRESVLFWDVDSGIAGLLVGAGADVNTRDADGRTALHWAVESDNADLIRFLLVHGAVVNALWRNMTPLRLARVFRRNAAAKVLSDLGGIACPELGGAVPVRDCQLGEALLSGDGPRVESLLAQGAHLENQPEFGEKPLEVATRLGSTELMRLLIDHGADPRMETEYGTLLHTAARYDQARAAELLLDSGVPVEQKEKEFGMTALHLAAATGSTSVLSLLLRQGSDPRGNDLWQVQPLHFAARWGNRDGIDALIAAGADPEANEPEMGTPLQQAVKNGCLENVRALVGHGARIGDRMLHDAGAGGHRRTYSFLLERGADPNAMDDNGWLPRLVEVNDGSADRCPDFYGKPPSWKREEFEAILERELRQHCVEEVTPDCIGKAMEGTDAVRADSGTWLEATDRSPDRFLARFVHREWAFLPTRVEARFETGSDGHSLLGPWLRRLMADDFEPFLAMLPRCPNRRDVETLLGARYARSVKDPRRDPGTQQDLFLANLDREFPGCETGSIARVLPYSLEREVKLPGQAPRYSRRRGYFFLDDLGRVVRFAQGAERLEPEEPREVSLGHKEQSVLEAVLRFFKDEGYFEGGIYHLQSTTPISHVRFFPSLDRVFNGERRRAIPVRLMAQFLVRNRTAARIDVMLGEPVSGSTVQSAADESRRQAEIGMSLPIIGADGNSALCYGFWFKGMMAARGYLFYLEKDQASNWVVVWSLVLWRS